MDSQLRQSTLIRQLQGAVGRQYDAAFSLSAGAIGSLAVPHGLTGTPQFVYGGVTGATSVEFITWGWTADEANITIYVKNHNSGSASITVRFRATL